MVRNFCIEMGAAHFVSNMTEIKAPVQRQVACLDGSDKSACAENEHIFDRSLVVPPGKL